MSSESEVRNLTVVCLRFPGEGSSTQGKSGPKARLKSVADGQLVDIPAPPIYRLNDAGTQEDSATVGMEIHGQKMSGTW